MYRLVLVEDNERERMGIAGLSLWAENGVEIVGAFGNGLSALHFIQKNQVDIVMTDVAMPAMNGLDLANELRSSFPGIKVLFVSCHPEFEYARQALKLNAEDYLLKPFTEEELETALSKTLALLEREIGENRERERMLALVRQSMPALVEQFYREMLMNEIKPGSGAYARASYLGLELSKRAFFAVAYYKVSHKQAEDDANESYVDSFLVRDIISSCAGGRMLCVVTLTLSHFACVYGAASGDSSEKFRHAIMDAASSAIERIEASMPVDTSAGLSSLSLSFDSLPTLFRQAEASLENSYFESSSRIVSYSEIEGAAASDFKENLDFKKMYQDLNDIFKSGSKDSISAFAAKYVPFGFAEREDIFLTKGKVYAIVNILQLICLEGNVNPGELFPDGILWKKLYRFNTIVNLRQWLENIIFFTMESIAGNRKSREQMIADSIRSVIAARYADQISVSDLLTGIYMSTGHANLVFKKATGMTIFDYLTAYRIDRAKELLARPDSRIYIVAEQVGYLNIAHFRFTFKKRVGVTPKEYKEKPF
ncbi:MAG: response regulator [Clostridiales bacterium]|jgi:YesN/AraC family two-component response regulator|nr:response regulator [Clostridiales bacterium]